MVIFDRLELSEDRKKVLIDVHVPDSIYHVDRYIDTITIDTQDTVLEHFSSPSPNPVFEYKVTGTENPKEVHLEVSKTDMLTFTGDFSKTLFFVYVKTKGLPFPPDTPCGQDDPYTLGVMYDRSVVYGKIMNFVREVASNCTIPKNFIDLILRMEALDISIKTKHYVQAGKMFNLVMGDIVSPKTVNCNCNGKSVI